MAFGSFTQSKLKNSVSVGWVEGVGGGGLCGEGTTRMISATAALRGSVNLLVVQPQRRWVDGWEERTCGWRCDNTRGR